MGNAASLPSLKPRTHQTLSFHLQPHDGDRPYAVRSNPFPRGSIVEVRPNESSFRDTYFSATVISSAGSNSISREKGRKKIPQKIHVSYNDLLVRKDKPTRLKGFVDVSCLRPYPPVQEIVEGFEPDDAVDALYNDGWWIGVVKRAVEGAEKRYVVSFQNPPDEREFRFSELRVHWDWVNGSWVRPDKQSIAGLMFNVGRKVEVSSDEEDCQGAWFPATIQQDNGNGTYLVVCSENTNNKVQNLEAKVIDSFHLRPSPPLLKPKSFVLLEKVDAKLFDCGWWSGVIRQELKNNRYLVFFKQLNTQYEFSQSELRPHMDWKDSKWFTSSQDVPTPPSEGGILEHPPGENLSAPVLNVPANSLGDEKTSCGKRTWSKQRHSGGKNNSSRSYVKNSSSQVSQVENQKPKVEGTKRAGLDKNAKAVQNEDTKQGLQIPVILALECAEKASDGFGKSRGKRARGSISKKITNTVTEDDSTDQNIEDITRSELVEFSGKRKRGRPRRQAPVIDDLNEKDEIIPKVDSMSMENSAVIVAETQESIVMETPESSVMRTPEVMVMETSPRNQEKTTMNKEKPINGRSDANDRKGTSATKLEEKVAKENPPRETLVFKRRRRRSTPTVQVQDSFVVPGSKSVKTNSALQVKTSCETPDNEFDDQPLSKLFEGIHNPSAVDSSKPSALVQFLENEKQKDDASDKHQESETPILAMKDTCSAVPLEQPSLPFVKTNLLWKTIDQTMDVFKLIPQNPHFRPLHNVKECLREGIAIGHMVTFCSVVEKASNLRSDTPKIATDDLLETLAALETHGFNVGPIQNRVAEFIVVREKEEKLVDDADGLRCQQIEHAREMDKIEDEIQKLKGILLMYEYAKRKEKSVITGLEARLKETEDGIKNVRREFEVIVSTPLSM